MKKLLCNRITMLMAVVLCLTSFSSCEKENSEAEYWFAGEWYVVGFSRDCPYVYDDTFYFYPNQRVLIESYYDGVIRGTWSITRFLGEDYINVFLPMDGATPSISGRIVRSSDHTITLKVSDKDYGDYTMTLSVDRYYNYARKKGITLDTKRMVRE